MSVPESNFYVTGGTLRSDAPSYVERQADKDLLEGLRKGEFCYVLTSRQMGKSSLMVRTASKLREQSMAVAVLDLTAIGQNLTAEQWYHGLLMRMGRQLDLEGELEKYWDAHPKIGPCQRFFDAVRDVVLPNLNRDPKSEIQNGKSLVIFVDEIDTVRSLPFSTDEFFAAIRECYNRRAEEPDFNRLTFCLLGVARPSDLIRDSRLTPFNIGRRIELNDFTIEEAAVLANGLEGVRTDGDEDTVVTRRPGRLRYAQQLLQRALYWTHGHPYLTQRLCGAVLERSGVKDQESGVRGQELTPDEFMDEICAELFFSARARERDDNLVFVREHLLRTDVDRSTLFHLYEKVLRGRQVPDDETSPLIGALRLTGIVRVTPRGLVERNRIYVRVFDRRWIEANMPGAELRRQRAAFRRGVVRATAIAAVIIGAMTVMVLIAANEAAKARRALAQSYLSQARAGRMSGLSGQRYESLKALREARRYHANEAVLRDEMIACLALPDLEEKQETGVRRQESRGRGPGERKAELNFGLGLAATVETNGSVALRNLNGQLLPTLPGFGRSIRRLRFVPNAAILLAEYEVGSEYQIVVWDCQKGEKLFDVPHGIHANAVDFSAESPGGSAGKLALGQENGRVVVYAVPRGKILSELQLKWESGLPRAPQVLRFDPSGELLAESCLDDLNVQVWDLNTGRKILPFYHPAKVFDLSWHPQGELLATACGDGCIYLWDTNRTDRPLKKLIGHEDGVKAIAFNHRGTLLASAGLDETLRLWSPATERHMARRLEGEILDRLEFSGKDDLLIANVEGSQSTRAWNVSGDEYFALLVRAGLADKLHSLDFSPDGRWLAAANDDRTMIWDCWSGRELGALSVSHAHAASFAAGSRQLIASTDGGLFHYALEEVTNGHQPRLQAGLVRQLPQVPEELGAMALSFDRSTAVIVHQDQVNVVSLAAGTNATAPAIPVRQHYRWLALHPDGMWMAAMTMRSNSIDIWNLARNGGAIGIATSAVPVVGATSAVPVGVTTSTIPISATTSAVPATVTISSVPAATISSSEYFVFSPDGKWLVTCWAGRFQFYQVGGWLEPAFTIPRLPASTQHAPIAFSRDGSMVALASSRYIVQLRKFTGDGRSPPKLIASLESPDRSPLEILAFSPDGRRLAAATMNVTVQLWNLASLRNGLAELNLEQDWPKYP